MKIIKIYSNDFEKFKRLIPSNLDFNFKSNINYIINLLTLDQIPKEYKETISDKLESEIQDYFIEFLEDNKVYGIIYKDITPRKIKSFLKWKSK